MKTSHYVSLFIFIIAGIGLWNYPDSQQQRAPKNILRVGTNAEYPPFSLKKDGKIVGFDIDIVKDIAKRMGKTVVFANMDFDMLIPQLQFGAIDIVAAGISETPERANQVSFTTPHLCNDPFLIVTLANKPPVTSIGQLIGKKIIVNQGFTAELYMQQIPGPILQALPTVADAFVALEQGKGYAFVTAASAVTPYFKKYGKDKFRVSRIPGSGESYNLAISRKNPTLLKKVQETLNSMKKDGTLTKLQNKWEL